MRDWIFVIRVVAVVSVAVHLLPLAGVAGVFEIVFRVLLLDLAKYVADVYLRGLWHNVTPIKKPLTELS